MDSFEAIRKFECNRTLLSPCMFIEMVKSAKIMKIQPWRGYSHFETSKNSNIRLPHCILEYKSDDAHYYISKKLNWIKNAEIYHGISLLDKIVTPGQSNNGGQVMLPFKRYIGLVKLWSNPCWNSARGNEEMAKMKSFLNTQLTIW